MTEAERDEDRRVIEVLRCAVKQIEADRDRERGLREMADNWAAGHARAQVLAEAEVARMRPVVEAAEAAVDGLKETFGYSKGSPWLHDYTHKIVAAVDAYREATQT